MWFIKTSIKLLALFIVNCNYQVGISSNFVCVLCIITLTNSTHQQYAKFSFDLQSSYENPVFWYVHIYTTKATRTSADTTTTNNICTNKRETNPKLEEEKNSTHVFVIFIEGWLFHSFLSRKHCPRVDIANHVPNHTFLLLSHEMHVYILYNQLR